MSHSTLGSFVTADFQLASRKLRYARAERDAASLAMIHGVLRGWNYFLPLASHLGTRYDLWSIDQRGHGASSKADRYLVVDYVADAIAWLEQCVDRPVVLYGHSLGAMVAAATAAARPELLRGLVIEDPPFETMGSNISQTVFQGYFTQIARLVAEPRPTVDLARALAEMPMTDPATGKTRRLGEMRDAVALRYMAASLRCVDPKVLEPIVAGRWLEGYDVDGVFSAIACPVLVLQADQAAGGMLADEAVQRLKARARGDVSHIRLSGVGHAMHWQRTQEIANLVFAFMESLDS